MSYESVIVLFIVFLIPAWIFVVTRVIHSRQNQKDEQAELDLVFSTYLKNSGKSGLR